MTKKNFLKTNSEKRKCYYEKYGDNDLGNGSLYEKLTVKDLGDKKDAKQSLDAMSPERRADFDAYCEMRQEEKYNAKVKKFRALVAGGCGVLIALMITFGVKVGQYIDSNTFTSDLMREEKTAYEQLIAEMDEAGLSHDDKIAVQTSEFKAVPSDYYKDTYNLTDDEIQKRVYLYSACSTEDGKIYVTYKYITGMTIKGNFQDELGNFSYFTTFEFEDKKLASDFGKVVDDTVALNVMLKSMFKNYDYMVLGNTYAQGTFGKDAEHYILERKYGVDSGARFMFIVPTKNDCYSFCFTMDGKLYSFIVSKTLLGVEKDFDRNEALGASNVKYTDSKVFSITETKLLGEAVGYQEIKTSSLER